MSGSSVGDVDLWALVREHLPHARREAAHLAAFVEPTEAEIEAKFRRGEAEHGRTWTSWDDADFDLAIAEELIDLIAYCAMRRVLRVPPFTTNADPGDEQA